MFILFPSYLSKSERDSATGTWTRLLTMCSTLVSTPRGVPASVLVLLLSWTYVDMWDNVAEGHGQKARLCYRLISDSIFCLFYFTPTLARKLQKNYSKEKTATDKRRRRFFYTFLYLLGCHDVVKMLVTTRKRKKACSRFQEDAFSFTHASSLFPVRDLWEFLQI